MNHHGRYNPIRLLAALMGLCLLLAAAIDPGLFRLTTPDVAAVGGYVAVDALGQLGTDDEPFYTSNGANNVPNTRGFGGGAGIAIDSVNHRMFVTDRNTFRVLVFNLNASNQLVDRVADNVLGQTDFHAAEVATDQNSLRDPAGVAYDSNHDFLFVADGPSGYACRVLVFDLSGGITDGMDATYVLGRPNFTDTSCTSGPTEIRAPYNLTYDTVHDRLFVNEIADGNIRVFDLVGGITDGMAWSNTLGGGPGLPPTQSSGYLPAGLAYDGVNDRLFAADAQDNRVMVFDTDTIVDGENAVNVIGHATYTDNSSGTSQTQFAGPSGVVYASGSERLFVGDLSNNRVMVFDVDPSVLIPNNSGTDGPDAIFELGQMNDGDPYDSNVAATTATGLNSPDQMAWDPVNNLLFVGDSSNSRFVIYDVTAITNGEAAVDGLGQLDENDDMIFTSALVNDAPNPQGFNNVSGTLIDTVDHRLFVADYDNHRVLVFELDLSNQLVDHTADFVLGQPDFQTVTSDTTPSSMFQPIDFAYDYPTKRLFVADTFNNRILVFDLSLGITNGMDAANVIGQPDLVSNDTATDQDHMHLPSGIALDQATQRLFVAEDGDNRRITVWNAAPGFLDGEPALYVLGQPDFDTGTSGTSQDKIAQPGPLLFDGATDRLYAIDYPNNRVMIWDLLLGISSGMLAANVLGQEDFTSSTANTSQDGLSTPYGVALDTVLDRLFVADIDNSRVLIFDISGGITDGMDADDVIGQSDFTTSGGGTSQTQMATPDELTFDQDNSLLYVSDSSSNRIMVFDVTPPVTTTEHTATDILGQLTGADEPDFDHSGINNSPNSRGFADTVGPTIDTVHHRLFTADFANNRVLVFNLETDNTLSDRIADNVLGQPDFRSTDAATTQSGMNLPIGTSVNDAGTMLFVSDWENRRVLVFDISGSITDGMDASFELGQPNDADPFDSADGATTASGNERVTGTVVDDANNLVFVADYGNQRVLVYDISGGITNGMDATYVIGKPDFTSSGSQLTERGMGFPFQISHDTTDFRLFVPDNNQHRVLVYDVSLANLASEANGGGTATNAINVLGQPDFTSDGTGNGADEMNLPGGTAYDPNGQRLFVADTGNNRATVFDVDPGTITNGEPADNVLGQPGFGSSGSGVSQTEFSLAETVFYDIDNDLLYVTDGNRIPIFDVSAITNGDPAVDLLGQLDEDNEPFYTTNADNNAPNAQGLEEADGVAVDTTHHRLFALDLENDRVLVFNLNTDNTLQDHTADFVLGQPDFKSRSPGTSVETLNEPGGISYDSADDLLFVADTSNNRVIVYDTATITNGEDAMHQIGQPDFDSGDCNQGATADSDTLCHPLGISIEPTNGFLAVSDQDNNRVLVYDLGGAGLPLLADGMDASRVFGQPDFTSTTGGTAADAMGEPSGILAETTTGSIWVTEEVNNRVLRFDLFAASSDPALNVLGQPNFTSGGEATTQSGMTTPVGVAIIESGGSEQRLFVVDGGNSRVLVFNTADGIDDGEDAVDAYGQPTFSDSDCTTTQTGLCLPSGVDYDETLETLYVADSNNHRVMVFGPEPSGGGDGGGGGSPPTPVGFTPGRIIINEDDGSTDSRNVLVQVYATTTGNFTGTVDVLLSNTTEFTTFVPFRYVIPEQLPNGNNTRDIWPKTIAWDLCFGITDTTQCSLGNKTVYARFYVNVPAPTPALVRPNGGNMVSSQ